MAESLIPWQRYIDAFKVLVPNRNTLIHANLVRGMNEQVGVFTTNRKGVRQGDAMATTGASFLFKHIADRKGLLTGWCATQ